MATGTVRIVLVAIGIALGVFVIARAFPSGATDVSTSGTSSVEDGTTTTTTGPDGQGGGSPATGGEQGGGAEDPTGMDVRILVSNGTDVSGLAEGVADFVSGLGYTSVDFGDADSNFSETTIYYQRDAREQAQQLREAVHKRALLRPATADSDYEINIVLGADYVG